MTAVNILQEGPLPAAAPALARPPGRLLALDPGTSTGLALFISGALAGAWCLTGDAEPGPCASCPLCRGRSCSHVVIRAAQIIGALLVTVPQLRQVDTVVIERPAYWKSTPDLPGLLVLADLAGALQGAALVLGIRLVMAFTPRAWKRTEAKDVHQREILAALDERERALLPRRPKTGRFVPDPLDACGLGLFVLGRLGQWQTDPATFAGQVEAAPRRGRRRQGSRSSPAQGGFSFRCATEAGGEPLDPEAGR